MSDFRLISSTPRKSRQGNGLVVLKVLQHFGALSRAELAREMGLNRSSSGYLIADLIEKGLVRECLSAEKDNENSGRGRPGILIELVPEAAYFLGIEIGVEHITTIIINLKSETVALKKQDFACGRLPAEAAVKKALEQADSMMNDSIRERLEGVGFSVPAQMNSQGYIFHAPLLKWQNINFVELACQALPANLPVKVENDANAYAIGKTSPADNHQGVTLYLVIESGVGGAIIIDGNLFRGGNGLAAEIGHLMLQQGEMDAPQNLETLIGMEHLLSRYQQARAVDEVTLVAFLRAVEDREPVAVMLADEWAKYLSYGLIHICRVIDPNDIIIGGTLAALYKLVAARVKIYITELQDLPFPLPKIVTDEDAESGSAYGAACIIYQDFFSFENPRFLVKEI